MNGLVAAAWIWRAVDLYRNLPRVPDLHAQRYAESLPPGVKLAVIVPACNEEAAIEHTLRSLLAQEGIALEIVAVDDRSRDRTGAILDRLAAEVGPSLRILHIHDLPPGWMGKQNALAQGMELTTAPYLLFTDGDIYFRPDALRRAMRFVLDEQADHAVLLPTPVIRSFGEHMMISALQVLSAWAVRLWRVPDPHSRDRIGVGAFNLVRREAFDSIGGFQALRLEVLEDVRLAVEIKRHDLRQRVAFGAGLVTVHWASGLIGIVRNVTKNFFAGFQFNPAATLLGSGALLLLGVYPFACFFGPAPMRMASAATFGGILSFYVRFRRKGGSSPFYALLFPFATVVLVYALLRSMTVTLVRGAVVWRGTSYPLKELRRQGGPLL